MQPLVPVAGIADLKFIHRQRENQAACEHELTCWLGNQEFSQARVADEEPTAYSASCPATAGLGHAVDSHCGTIACGIVAHHGCLTLSKRRGLVGKIMPSRTLKLPSQAPPKTMVEIQV